MTDELAESSYDILLYLRRAALYADLAYPDLAAGDAYRALLLTDEISDESFEYHGQTHEAMAPYAAGEKALPDFVQKSASSELASGVAALSISSDLDETAELDACRKLASTAAIRCYQILSLNLLLCGCLRSAHSFCERGLAVDANDKDLQQTKTLIDTAARKRYGKTDDASFTYNPTDLPDRGLVRREVYPWNTYEPDRFSAESLAFLNDELSRAAPKCEVRATELPILTEKDDEGKDAAGGEIPTCWQLGVFAKEPIAAGEAVLKEYSLLTANNRLKESACDACGTELPTLAEVGKKKKKKNKSTRSARDDTDDEDEPVAAPVACPECYDTVFCDEFCFEQAQEKYHPAVCETDVDSIAKDPEDARDADDALYVLLLARLLAMATHQEVHPLEVNEIKYIWGDFVPPQVNAGDIADDDKTSTSPSSPHVIAMAAAGGIPPAAWSLPFSFEANIATPLHILEKMDLDVFADLAHYDLWVLNSCYSKFRGTASARKSRRDGRPDVAAVHPLWCLANHDCDPNVTWEWGGRMVLWAREERVKLDPNSTEKRPGGIEAGQEILNHYCDVDLPVQLRREWASGSLGGACMCQRCRNEAAEEAKKA